MHVNKEFIYDKSLFGVCSSKATDCKDKVKKLREKSRITVFISVLGRVLIEQPI